MTSQIPSTFDASQAMAFDGCFHDDDEIELTPYPGSRSRTMTSDPRESPAPSVAGGNAPPGGAWGSASTAGRPCARTWTCG